MIQTSVNESAIIFSPYYGNQGNTVSSTLSGSGDLLTADVNRSGFAMAFTGDHSAFTGALSDAVGGGALDGTLNIALDPTCVEGRDEITLATATGGVSGTPTVEGNVPSQWMLLARTNSLVLKKIKGTMLIVR